MTKHEYICEITMAAAKKSTCNRAAVGAVIVNEDYEVITTGYNGAPKGIESCDAIGHAMKHGHCLRSVHAELNAIIQAAKHGVSVKGCTMYVTHSPCYHCAKVIINSGITHVMYMNKYDDAGIKLLKLACIYVVQWKEIKGGR